MTRKTIAALAVAATAASAAPANAAHEAAVGLGEDGTSIFEFDIRKPNRSGTPVVITGAATALIGIDRRPATGALYGVGTDGAIYTLDQETGAATRVATMSVTPVGTDFGVDFNPVPDRLRVVSDADQNLRTNVDTGATIADGGLAYAPGDVLFGTNPTMTGAAYTNNRAGTTTTRLYDIDAALGTLAVQAPPNDGVLRTVGALGTGGDLREVGFDIFTSRAGANLAYASLGKDGTEKLYSVDLTSGQATKVGPFGEQGVRDIALEVVR